jgi:peptide/nickel transport system ATP-binding protein/oligopeptide transport system ATP-binding protein
MTVQTFSASAQVLLDIRGLQVVFALRQGIVPVIRHLDLQVYTGETLGLVGESGCGKSLTGLAVLGLVPEPGRIEGGKILFQGKNLVPLSNRQMRRVRGKGIAMVFQDPMTALNPVYSIGNQLVETLILHHPLTRREAHEKALFWFNEVGLPEPRQQFKRYPHELSGGQRQRVMIAMALSGEPDLLIADEPTTALDVTIQAQILDLLMGLQQKYRISILLITHDLGIVAETAQRVAVMYAGDIVETSFVNTLFDTSKHPYTRGLLAARLPLQGTLMLGDRLAQIPGQVPSFTALPPGCPFQNRCPQVTDICQQAYPPITWAGNHGWRCFNTD